MRIAQTILVGLLLVSCGDSGRDGEVIGQVKRVWHVTPLICPDYMAADVSLGIMRNGTGSMSAQDMIFTVRNTEDIKALQAMAASGALVKVHYDTRRLPICTEGYIMTAAEITQ